jgi:hypothetical protein
LAAAFFLLNFFQSPARARKGKGKDYGLFLVKNTMIIVYHFFISKKELLFIISTDLDLDLDLDLTKIFR